MNKRHRKTLKALFARPTSGSIRFSDIEALVVGLGGAVDEGKGSRVVFALGDAVIHLHRTHPGKEARKYQIEEICLWLEQQGVQL
jgi:hypothetical protein